MVNGVNNNAQSLIALQNLNATNKHLEGTTDRISSGLKIASAKDNAAVFSVAQSLRGENSAYDIIQIGLDRSKSVGDVAITAGETASDILIQLREKALSATKEIDAESRAAFQEDFTSLMTQFEKIVGAAEFDGVNLLNNSQPAGLEFVADASGASTLRIDAEDFSFGGVNVTLDPATHDLSDPANAQLALDAVKASITNVNGALSRLGASSQKIDNHANFVSRLQDVITEGVGGLVDADLGKESALLQSLQVKQQLGVQALSIANESPQAVLSLFQN
ncbi:flagellin [Hirschia baltica]|uniref:Flagellin n=1 Tax=Hirschia baltica (strain ATCC 49814 / DSM 5838 / IFAM 1418) TaxID=582402 RepID=C6XMT3_HIRBI|nr:flagellin [Hirschia baltica]ACT59997.1 flagellin domain protein [Hirschia baltica ATCC 49814]